MTGPFEHVTSSTEVRVLRGRIELDEGGRKVVATVLGGEATIELIERFDAQITTSGVAEPIRYVGRIRTLRLEIEAPLDEMVITVDPPNGPAGGTAWRAGTDPITDFRRWRDGIVRGDGEAAASPDGHRRF